MNRQERNEGLTPLYFIQCLLTSVETQCIQDNCSLLLVLISINPLQDPARTLIKVDRITPFLRMAQEQVHWLQAIESSLEEMGSQFAPAEEFPQRDMLVGSSWWVPVLINI